VNAFVPQDGTPGDAEPDISTVRLVSDRHFFGLAAMDYTDTGNDGFPDVSPSSCVTLSGSGNLKRINSSISMPIPWYQKA